MKMTWKQYRKECQMSNVEPVRADFKSIERSYEQIDAQIARSLEQQPKTMVATAGR